MTKNTLFKILFVAVLVSIVIYTMTSGEDESIYIATIEKHREDKDRDMRYAEDSPFAPDSVEYKGLKYFPIDINYKIKAKLEPIADKKIVTLPTSDGASKQYLQYAYASFELHDKENKLLILETVGGAFDGLLFLAFGDETSAIESYGAGRYLELEKQGAHSITIDFNKAYNPYCAYVDGFSCPFPPKENLLSVPVRAGERVYQ